MKKSYSIGIDYGTLSVRCVLVDINDGKVKDQCEYVYPHGVISDSLPDGTQLPKGFALANPADYLEGLYYVINTITNKLDLNNEEIVGIGLDCTSSSVIAVDKDLTPIMFTEKFSNHPHAYIKLWKHHGAAIWGKKIEEYAFNNNCDFLNYYGGQVNCELMMPKAFEAQADDPELWNCSYAFLEVADWICSLLSGHCICSHAIANCNNFYRDDYGYPSYDFFKSISPEFTPASNKFVGHMYSLGSCVGKLSETQAKKLGLPNGIPIAAPLIDSHASMAGCGADNNGDIVAVIGTSACYLLNSNQVDSVKGIYSVAWETCVPNLFTYEGGQSCAGDALQWFVDNCVPESYYKEADSNNISIHELMCQKYKKTKPHKLISIDWWNGARSPYMQPDKTGIICGLTLNTRPEEIYGSFLEAICFGARTILETLENSGHKINRLFAAGGIPGKNPFMMQMLSDILGKDILVCDGKQTSAHGSAIMGASVAINGNKTLTQCISDMHLPVLKKYKADLNSNKEYENQYIRYKTLSELIIQNNIN